jgi:hypothetical protein
VQHALSVPFHGSTGRAENIVAHLTRFSVGLAQLNAAVAALLIGAFGARDSGRICQVSDFALT